ncbi:MAG: chorismate-binding protein [Ichthyobacteriaceae bacterium]|nr:chorismate-binding protein [Ichthyobacteriaceae bacterium]
MKNLKITTNFKKKLADTITPVSLYLKLRDIYPNSVLLESSDYHSKENSYSFICLNPLVNLKVDNNKATVEYTTDNTVYEEPMDRNFTEILDKLSSSFKIENGDDVKGFNGFYGYIAYNAIEYFETIKLTNKKSNSSQIPSIQFSFFKNIIAINHFKNEMMVIENVVDGQKSKLNKLLSQIESQGFSSMPFELDGKETSNITDENFMKNVENGKHHCRRGDVFQIVLSRQFKQAFNGDDFNVYRSLRSINPSPYLFYFNYEDFNLMGSSPEAQIKVENGKALINPIAGTFRRTGNDAEDKELAVKLSNDPKENAEHVMLVDLARNDLSRHCKNVEVRTYKEVQYFSHVIHLVSAVDGDVKENAKKVIESTFPAGTLSGAPKYKAMQLIDKYENQDRGFYGGAVGYIGLDGEVNLAIAIRSFVSKDNVLYSQAGAGITEKSNKESELQEVNNKLFALKKAVEMAETI